MSPAICVLACLPWPPSAVGSSAATFVIPSTRKFSAEQQVALRAGHLAGHAQPFGARGELLRFDAQLVDLHLHVERRLARRARRAP